MPLPKHVRDYVERTMTVDYCANRVSERVRDRLRVGFQTRGNSVTPFEERPQFQNPSHWIKVVIAQFRYNYANGQWSLSCADRNSRWHDYEFNAARDIRTLLREVDADPTGIFWG
ncbi:MAG TPA: hypothetical protein DCP63_04220 [Bacteroidetes bacterium]|nr:hypothetical protein [Bacteroidota bacterium]